MADLYTVDAVAWEEFIADWRQYVAGDPKMPFFRVREGLVAVIDSAQKAQQPAAAVPAEAWTCGSCGQRNSAWSNECGRCEAAKEAPAGYVPVPRAALAEVIRISDRSHPAWDAVKAAMIAAAERKGGES